MMKCFCRHASNVEYVLASVNDKCFFELNIGKSIKDRALLNICIVRITYHL